MAKIPTDLPQVNAAPLPGVQVSPESFGAGAGRALSELGGTVVNFTTKLQNDANTAEAQDIMNKVSKAGRESLYRVQGVAQDGSQADTVPGYLTLSGKNAVNARPKYQSEYDKTMQALRDGASSDKVRELIKGPMSNAANNYASVLGRYAVSQQKVAEKVIAATAGKEAEQTAISNAGNTPQVLKSVDDAATIVYNYTYKYTGDAGAAKSLAETATTKIHVGVINNLLKRGDVEGAMTYYKKITQSKQYASGFDTNVRGEMLKIITDRTRLKKVQDTVNGYQGSFDLSTSIGAEKTLAAARKIANPTLQKAVIQELKLRINEVTTLEKKKTGEYFNDTVKNINDGSITNQEQLDPNIIGRFSPTQISALDKMIRFKRTGGEPANNSEVWGQFVARTDLSKISEPDLFTTYRPYLDNKHFDQALKLWKAAQSGKVGILTPKDVMKNALINGGYLDVKNPGTDQLKRAAQFYDNINRDILASFPDKTPSLGEVQKIVDQEMTDMVFVNKFWGDKKFPTAILIDDEISRAYVPLAKISRGDRAALGSALERNKIEITDRNLERLAAAAKRSTEAVRQMLEILKNGG